MSQSLLPVALNLEAKQVLLVGAGRVAVRKAHALAESGARLRVIATSVKGEFPSQAQVCVRGYRAGDCKGAQLVFAATDDVAVNSEVAAEARSLGIWCNNVSAPQESDFHSAAVIRRGPITVGVSTSGVSPILAQHIKDRIADTIGPEYLQLMEIGEVTEIELQYRADFWQRALDGRVLELLKQGQLEGAVALVREFTQGSNSSSS